MHGLLQDMLVGRAIAAAAVAAAAVAAAVAAAPARRTNVTIGLPPASRVRQVLQSLPAGFELLRDECETGALAAVTFRLPFEVTLRHFPSEAGLIQPKGRLSFQTLLHRED